MLYRQILSIIPLLLVMTVFCTTRTEDEFNENKAKWQRSGIIDYSYTIINIGFLPPDQRHIHVSNNVIDSVYLLSDSLTVPDSLLGKYCTIEDLFDEVEKNINSKNKISVSYNNQYGFPETVYSDHGEEGSGFIVIDFSSHFPLIEN